MSTIQLTQLFSKINKLQLNYGVKSLNPVYGAGCITNPKYFFVFMNPTAKNVSASPHWKGIRAPWLGTKEVWKYFNRLNLIETNLFNTIQNFKPHEWTPEFSRQLYSNLAKNRIYITNLAKCTQIDARPLSNSIFRNYLPLLYQEILLVKPKLIVSFGGLVSTQLLQRPINIGRINGQVVSLTIGPNSFPVMPVYYPVGQGTPNQPFSISALRHYTSASS